MTEEISLRDAKARLSELLDRVENGEEIVITRHGKPSVKITTVEAYRRSPGALKGNIKIADDFDQTPDHIIDEFEGK